MPDVFSDMKHLFVGPSGPVREDAEPAQADLQVYRQFCEGVVSWAEAPAYVEYRRRLTEKISSTRPDPRLGMEAAAASALQRDGLQTACDILDLMVRQAREGVGNG